MIRVRCAGRLHFGLLSPGEADGRHFGGAGLMVEQPGFVLTAEPATSWSASGPLAERALAVAQRFGAVLPHRLVIEQAPPEHCGLGTGTQLALAVGRALAVSTRLTLNTTDLARRVGRGLRSAIGIHGFEHGGFLIDGGKRTPDSIAPLVARMPFPETWRVVLVLPTGLTGLHADAERRAFARLDLPDLRRTHALCYLALLGMLPALAECDLKAFGQALHEFNACAGEAFVGVQGGVYCTAWTDDVVRWVRLLGVPGVGQSSWGPAVFAVVGDAEAGEWLAKRLRERFALETEGALVTRAANVGATCQAALSHP